MAITAPWQASADRDVRLGAFARARRHSRVVRALRVLLPLLGVGIVAGFVVATQLRLPAGLDLDAARLSVTRNSIIMDRPHLTGFDRNHREYSVAAARAIQPFSNPGQVRLEDLEAKIESETGALTTITAEAGDYDHNKRTLQLYGTIKADSPEGYELNLTDADIDFEAGTLVTENPVTVGHGDSRVSGKRLTVSDSGKVIVLEGEVKTLLMPPKREAVEAAPAAE